MDLYAAGPVCIKDLSTLKMITNSQNLTPTLTDCHESVHFFIKEVWVENEKLSSFAHCSDTDIEVCALH